jgi:colanic acid/amylovoran biosynthesis glycosyltransferase
MNIAVVMNSFPELSETFILNQIVGLIGMGHHVDVIAFYQRQANARLHADIYKHNFLSKAIYINLPKGHWGRLRKFLSIFLRNLTQISRLMKCLRLRKYTMWDSINNVFKLEPFLRRSYDVIHCHYGEVGRKMVFIKDVFPEIKFVTTFHGYDLSKYIQDQGPDIYPQLFQAGDLFLPVSRFWHEKLIALRCPRQKIIVHHMGIDVNRFSQVVQPNHNEKIDILTVGRLVEKKGIEFSIRAVARLIPSFPSVHYNIIGDGLLKKNFENLIAELHASDHIHLLGAKPREEVIGHLKESHILMLASVTAANGDMEGIPVTLMEAQAMGLPVIATYHSGIPELVRDRESGFLVPERDVEALVEKLRHLITHPELRLQMGTRGRKIVEDEFNIHALNRRLEKIFLNGLSEIQFNAQQG